MISQKDYFEVQNLITAYSITTDNVDVDGFMNTWVSPEEFGGYKSEAFGNMDTWEAMQKFETEHTGEGGMANGKRHQVTNVYIEFIDDNTAHVTHDLIVLEVAEIPQIIATGRYNNSVVVRTNKGWRFKSRTLDVDSGFFKLMEKWKAASSENQT